jgi:hypothetical protein
VGNRGQAANLSRLALLHAHMLRSANADAASRRAVALLESMPPAVPRATAYGLEASQRLLDRQIAQCEAWSSKSIALAEQWRDPLRLCYSQSTLRGGTACSNPRCAGWHAARTAEVAPPRPAADRFEQLQQLVPADASG